MLVRGRALQQQSLTRVSAIRGVRKNIRSVVPADMLGCSCAVWRLNLQQEGVEKHARSLARPDEKSLLHEHAPCICSVAGKHLSRQRKPMITPVIISPVKQESPA